MTLSVYYRTLIILGALIALGPLSIDMYLPSLPTIAAQLAVDDGAVQLTLSSYLFAFALGQLFYGPLSDTFGRRPLVLVGLCVFILSSVLCAVAETIESLIVFRFFQALGGAACSVIARAVVRDLYEGEAAAKAMSVVMLVVVVAPMIAPLCGGFVLKWFGWNMIFYLLAAVSAVLLVVVLLRLDETHAQEKRVAFGMRSYLRAYLEVLSNRVALAHTLSGAFAFAAMFVYIAGTPFVFIEIYGVAPEHYGYFFGVNAIGMMAATYLNSRVVERYSIETVLRVSYLLSCLAGMAILVCALAEVPSVWMIFAPIFVILTLMGSISVNSIVMIMKPFPALAGTASSVCGASRFLFGSVAGVLLSYISDGSALPMALIMFLCTAFALFFNYLWAHRG